MKIGFLLALLMGQQVTALEITKTFTPEEIAVEVIAAPTLDEAKALLDHCDVEERRLVAQALQSALLQWVAVYGLPDVYGHIATHKKAVSVVTGVVSVAFIGAVAVAVGLTVHAILNAQRNCNNAAYAFDTMGKATNEKWHGKSDFVNGVLISSPYFVDGQKLVDLCNDLKGAINSFEGIEHYIKAAGYCALGAITLGLAAKGSYDEACDMDHHIHRCSRMQELIAYLEK